MTTASPAAEFSEVLRSANDYYELKQGLITLNAMTRQEDITAFDGGKMGMHNGDRIGLYFPHPDDKDALLNLAFDFAKDHTDIGRAAMQLGSAIVVAHPFLDGNGRTSRGVHAAILGKSDQEIAELGIAAFHPGDEAGIHAQERINLAPPFQLEPYIQQVVYKLAGDQPDTSYLAQLRCDKEGMELYSRIKARLNDDEREDLDSVFMIKDNGEVDRDMPSLEFALNGLDASNHELEITKEKTLSTGRSRFIVDIPRTLAPLNDAELKKFLSDVWRYRRLRAEAAIECLASGKIGETVINLVGVGVASVAEHYTRLTPNLLSASQGADKQAK